MLAEQSCCIVEPGAELDGMVEAFEPGGESLITGEPSAAALTPGHLR